MGGGGKFVDEDSNDGAGPVDDIQGCGSDGASVWYQ